VAYMARRRTIRKMNNTISTEAARKFESESCERRQRGVDANKRVTSGNSETQHRAQIHTLGHARVKKKKDATNYSIGLVVLADAAAAGALLAGGNGIITAQASS